MRLTHANVNAVEVLCLILAVLLTHQVNKLNWSSSDLGHETDDARKILGKAKSGLRCDMTGEDKGLKQTQKTT